MVMVDADCIKEYCVLQNNASGRTIQNNLGIHARTKAIHGLEIERDDAWFHHHVDTG